MRYFYCFSNQGQEVERCTSRTENLVIECNSSKSQQPQNMLQFEVAVKSAPGLR